MPNSHLDERRLAELAEERPSRSATGPDRRHLDSCAHCRQLLEGHRNTIQLLRGSVISIESPRRAWSVRELAAVPMTLAVAVVLLGVLVFGRGQVGPGSATASPAESASGSTTSARPSQAAVSASPPTQSRGVISITAGFDINPTVWSPQSGALAVVVRAQDIAKAEVRVFKADGTPIDTFSGGDVAWFDDDHLVTLESGAALTTGSLVIHTLSDGSSKTLAGSFATPLLGGPGVVAAGVTPKGDPTAPPTEFAVVTTDGSRATAQGVPTAWTADGSRLVVLRDQAGRRAKLAVVSYPDLKDIAIPSMTVATTPAPLFGPDGSLAVCAVSSPSEPCVVHLLDPKTGSERETTLIGDSGYLFWLGPAEISVPNADGTALSVWNVTAAAAAAPINGATVAASSSGGSIAFGSLPYGGPTITLREGGADRVVELPGALTRVPVWSPDGHRLAVVAKDSKAGTRCVVVTSGAGG